MTKQAMRAVECEVTVIDDDAQISSDFIVRITPHRADVTLLKDVCWRSGGPSFLTKHDDDVHDRFVSSVKDWAKVVRNALWPKEPSP